MPEYKFTLVDSLGPNVAIEGRNLLTDDEAISEARFAAGEVLLSELSENRARPQATVIVTRDGKPIARVRAYACIELMA